MGDFNDILAQPEKIGKHNHPHTHIWGFRDTIEDCGLEEVRMVRYPFAWDKRRGSPNWVEEKLDTCLVTNDWTNLFPSSRILNEDTFSSYQNNFNENCYQGCHLHNR